VREPLTISDDDILTRLRTRFEIDALEVEFLPLGYDSDAWVYRVRARGGDLFLKIRRGPFNEAGLAVPRLLAARGIAHLIAPIPTITGELLDAGELAFVLFPWVEGRSGGEVGLTAAQWTELGATMRAIHDVPVDAAFTSILRTEDFVPARIAKFREVQAAIEAHLVAGDPADDALGSELAACWHAHQDQIDRLVTLTGTLAPIARDRAEGPVICHADIHAWNVVVAPDGDIVIVDWDDAVLAPRERDLVFVDGIPGGHAADPDAFFGGYGDLEPDDDVIAYYRAEWAVQDLAAFASHVLLEPDAGDDARRESARLFVAMFEPGNLVEVSLRS
jgi:spectinomycin phosphotransferase